MWWRGCRRGGEGGSELWFDEAEEDEAEDGLGVLGGGETGVGAELVGGGLEASFEGGGGGVVFRRGDPLHSLG